MLKENKILAGQTIFDLSNISLGGMDNIMTLIALNPQFESLDVDLADFVGQNYIYDDAYYQNRTYQLQLPTPKEPSNIGTVLGYDNQSLEDLCLMAYGSLDFFVKFISDNNYKLNSPEIATKTATFDKSLVIDGSLKPILTKKGYILAGGLVNETIDNYRITENDITRYTEDLNIRIV